MLGIASTTSFGVLLVILFLIILSGIRFIPNNRIGIVEKRWSLAKGSVKGGLIALNGEAGYQPRILRGGLHYLMPIQVELRRNASLVAAGGPRYGKEARIKTEELNEKRPADRRSQLQIPAPTKLTATSSPFFPAGVRGKGGRSAGYFTKRLNTVCKIPPLR